MKKCPPSRARAFVSRSRRAVRATAIQGRRDHGASSLTQLLAHSVRVRSARQSRVHRQRHTNTKQSFRPAIDDDCAATQSSAMLAAAALQTTTCTAAVAAHGTAAAERAVSGRVTTTRLRHVMCRSCRRTRSSRRGEPEEKSIVYGRCRRARVRAGRRRALAAIPEDGQFVSSARFVMPAVVLPDRHCFAATTSTKSLSAAAADTAAAANTCATTTTTTTLFWLPVVDSPACYCCYCGGRLFVVGAGNNGSVASRGSVVGRRFDACSPFSASRYFGRPCRCGDGTAVVLLVPYVLGPPCVRPIVLPPAFVTAAAANHLGHHRRIQHHHQLYNAAVKNMETR